MILIVDANIIISALIREIKTREIITQFPSKLLSPDTLVSSVKKYSNLIIKKSRLQKREFEVLFESLMANITVVEENIYSDNIVKADSLIGKVDIENVPYPALALSVPNDGIWSDDKHLKQQKKVRVFTTEEIVKFISS